MASAEGLTNAVPTSKLDALFSSVEGSDEILAAVAAGKEKFLKEITSAEGLPPADSSATHSWQDLEIQAFTLAIPSRGNVAEMTSKAHMAFFAHWFDDLIDRPPADPASSQPFTLQGPRRDPEIALGAMGVIGELAKSGISAAKNPEAALKGFKRMMYGAHALRLKSAEVDKFLLEYQKEGAKGVSRDMRTDIRTISPAAYLLTTKTIQELFLAFEDKFDPDIAEAWSLLYAPAVYYHNIGEEKQRGEAMKQVAEPGISDLTKMIRFGAKHAKRGEDPKLEARIAQMKFLVDSFKKVIPVQLALEYQKAFQYLAYKESRDAHFEKTLEAIRTQNAKLFPRLTVGQFYIHNGLRALRLTFNYVGYREIASVSLKTKQEYAEINSQQDNAVRKLVKEIEVLNQGKHCLLSEAVEGENGLEEILVYQVPHRPNTPITQVAAYVKKKK